uniref:Uncharacterized protein n=1 Tax=Schizaphis graminum TaxID=13262 RepID=A0A2S2NGX6_SCHGA
MVVCGIRVLAVVVGCVDLLDNGVETVFVISCVLDHAGGAIRFHETVRSFDVTVTVTNLVLALDVVCVKVFHTVLEMIRLRCMVVVVGVVTFVLDGRISKGQVSEQSDNDYKLSDHFEFAVDTLHFCKRDVLK